MKPREGGRDGKVTQHKKTSLEGGEGKWQGDVLISRAQIKRTRTEDLGEGGVRGCNALGEK
jgi:hypothetical protein